LIHLDTFATEESLNNALDRRDHLIAFCQAKDRLECEIKSKKGIGSTATKRTRKASKRTVIQPHKGDRRYVRRNKAGQFKKEVNVGRSLAADRRKKAKTKVGKGQGDRGDT